VKTRHRPDRSRSSVRSQPGDAAVVIAGIDDSRTSMRAAAYAAGLARRQGSRLVLVHVERCGLAATLEPGVTVLLRSAEREATCQLWDHLGEEVDVHGLHLETVTVYGDVADKLTRIACDRGAAAVVVGASEQLRHRLIGSIGARLSACHRWPVVVVP
jgi:nucleotide-binding universal stress UspA family protein